MTAPTTEHLREMIAGTEGVTPGPWTAAPYSSVVGCPIVAQPDKTKNSILVAGTRSAVAEDPEGFRKEVTANAAHIARCDPATIRAMAEEVIVARKMIVKMAAHIDTEIKAAVLAEREAGEALCREHIVSTHSYPDGSFAGFKLVRVGKTPDPHTGWAYADAIRARQEIGT